MLDLGGAGVHSEISGNCDFVAPNDTDCIDQVRCLLSFIPSNPDLPAPVVPCGEDPVPDAEIFRIVPEKRRVAYDMHNIIERLVDWGAFMEVKARYARNIIIGFARIEGSAVGVIANQPCFLAGTLDSDAADKAARFIRFCDAFNIPLISLVDVPGYLPGIQCEYAGIIRHGAKMIYAYAESTVPKITIIIRKAYGGAFQAMCSKELGADQVWAWPTAEIAVMGPEGAAEIVYAREITNSKNPKRMKEEKIEEYREKFSNPYYATERLKVDAVIDPGWSRHFLKMTLKALAHKREAGPVRKHGNIPL
jgi:propionyl-CoA carboxylase beta chain